MKNSDALREQENPDQARAESRPGLGLDTALLAAVAAICSVVPLIGFVITAAGLWRTPGRLRLLFWGTAGLAVAFSLYRLASPGTTSEAFVAHAVVLFLGGNLLVAVWILGPFGYLSRIRSSRSPS